VSLVMSAPYLLLVHPAFPASNVKELLAVARSKAGGLNFGSSGIGSTAHLVAEIFRASAGVPMTHVPYKGSGPAAIDLMAGQLHLVFESVASSLPNVNAGRLRALGISTRERFPITPQIPTIDESGLAGFEAATWQGICAPGGTPQAVVGVLSRAIAQAARSTDSAERLAALGARAVGSSPQEFAAFVQAEIPRWAKAIRDSGAKAQ
jgi:tripartite-type tricarboxylate transporter receptor subunit TctC